MNAKTHPVRNLLKIAALLTPALFFAGSASASPRIVKSVNLSQPITLQHPVPIAVNAPDGTLVIGSYDSGKAVRYNPVTKQVMASVSGFQYINTIKVVDGRIYLGGADPEWHSKVWVYDLDFNLIGSVLSEDGWIHSFDVDKDSNILYYGTWGKMFAVDLSNMSKRAVVDFGNWAYAVSNVKLDKARNRAYLTVYEYYGAIARVVNVNLATEEVEAHVPIGLNPAHSDDRYDADLDGDKLFVTQQYSSSITVFNVVTNQVVKDIANVSWPQKLVCDTEKHRLYAVDNYTDKLHIIDTENLTLIKSVSPGDDPSGVCVDKGRDRIYTANFWSNDIGVADRNTTEMMERISFAPATPLDAAMGSDGNAYISNGPNGGLFVMDPADGRQVDKINLFDYTTLWGGEDFPAGVKHIFTGELEIVERPGAHPLGATVDEFGQSLAVIDLTEKRFLRYISPAGAPTSAASYSGVIFFPYVSNSVLYIGKDTDSGIVSLNLGASEKSQGIAVNSDTGKAYVADYSNGEIVVVDLAAWSFVKRIKVGTYPAVVRVDEASNLVYVSNYGSDSVSVIDGDTEELVRTIAVGSAPWGLQVNHATGRLYAVNTGDHSLSVINLKKNKTVGTLSVAEGARYCGVHPGTNHILVPGQTAGTVTIIEDVVDVMPPTVSCPIPVSVNTYDSTGTIVNFSVPPVSDNADSAPTVTVAPPSGSVFPVGITTVTVTASDVEDNTASCSFPVTVKLLVEPAPVRDLSAVALPYLKIALSWSRSPTPGVVSYRVYMGTDEIDYGHPAAALAEDATSWTAEGLTDGVTYKFVVRAVHRSGIEEQNTNMAAATAFRLPYCLSASIKSPQNGKKVSGERLTVTAEIRCPDAGGVSAVRFEYRPAAGGSWSLIPAANRNHPNPDMSSPYFVHWNVDDLQNGHYQVRAVALDQDGNADPAPASVTILVDHDDPDCREKTNGKGEVEKVEKIENQKTNIVVVSDEKLPVSAQVRIPEGALDGRETKVTVRMNPGSPPKSDVATFKCAGVHIEIELQSGQSILGKEATLTLPYADADDNGIVDGTDIRVNELEVCYFNPNKGKWEKMKGSVVDRSAKTVTCQTGHFSLFGLFSGDPSGASADFRLGEIFAFPNPAANGKDPTIHVESGLADSVELRFYDLSGALKHSATLSNAPPVIDGKYAYEYTWDVSGVASGVYVVAVNAMKDGKGTLRKLVRVAVLK